MERVLPGVVDREQAGDLARAEALDGEWGAWAVDVPGQVKVGSACVRNAALQFPIKLASLAISLSVPVVVSPWREHRRSNSCPFTSIAALLAGMYRNS